MSLKKNGKSLPKGWAWTTLGQLTIPSSERFLPKDGKRKYPFIGLEHIEPHTGNILAIGDSSTIKSSKTKFYAGDILYGRLRPYLNKIHVPNFNGICSTDILVFPKNPYYESKLLAYFLMMNDFVKFAKLRMFGVQHPRVSFSSLSSYPVPFSPLNEQRRIVSKIEKLFGKLDMTIEILKGTIVLLKRYRQSLLKSAFEGTLTKKWRQENEAAIKDFLNSINMANLSVTSDTSSSIPKGWMFSNLTKLGDFSRGKCRHRPRDDPRLFGGKYPFIQTGEVKNSNGLITSYQSTYNDFGLKQSKLWPPKTLCITIAANIAETAILGIPACFPDSIVGFIANKNVSNVKYVHYFLKSIRNRIEAYAPATAQKNINIEILKDIAIPFPTIIEQNKIVELIDYHLALIDNCNYAMNYSFKQINNLRQSILKSAFEGKIVPQNPNDESANVLLTRITEEKLKMSK